MFGSFSPVYLTCWNGVNIGAIHLFRADLARRGQCLELQKSSPKIGQTGIGGPHKIHQAHVRKIHDNVAYVQMLWWAGKALVPDTRWGSCRDDPRGGLSICDGSWLAPLGVHFFQVYGTHYYVPATISRALHSTLA